MPSRNGRQLNRVGAKKSPAGQVVVNTTPDVAVHNESIANKQQKVAQVIIAENVEAKPIHKDIMNSHSVQSPDVNMPDADVTSSEVGSTLTVVKSNVAIPSNQTLVEINDSDKSKFHYRTSNGKLTLYGDFKKSPYELIEIQADKGNTIYLKFEKQYYIVLNNQKQLKKLNAIQDKALLLKLSKVNNK